MENKDNELSSILGGIECERAEVRDNNKTRFRTAGEG